MSAELLIISLLIICVILLALIVIVLRSRDRLKERFVIYLQTLDEENDRLANRKHEKKDYRKLLD